jgi:hypothetical protein
LVTTFTGFFAIISPMRKFSSRPGSQCV